MKKKLRLLLWEECNRNCIGCCNKDWDLENLEIENDFTQYDEIYLTGGEPMLYPDKLVRVILDIKIINRDAKIYIYTTKTNPLKDLMNVLFFVDGLTVTLHEQKDVLDFHLFNMHVKAILEQLKIYDAKKKSLRLNVFKGIDLSGLDLDKWDLKDNIEWIKDCPLPKDEVFKKYKS